MAITTRQAADKIGVKVNTLTAAVWRGDIPEPEKLGKSFLWTHEDIARARSYFRSTGTGRIGQ